MLEHKSGTGQDLPASDTANHGGSQCKPESFNGLASREQIAASLNLEINESTLLLA